MRNLELKVVDLENALIAAKL